MLNLNLQNRTYFQVKPLSLSDDSKLKKHCMLPSRLLTTGWAISSTGTSLADKEQNIDARITSIVDYVSLIIPPAVVNFSISYFCGGASR